MSSSVQKLLGRTRLHLTLMVLPEVGMKAFPKSYPPPNLGVQVSDTEKRALALMVFICLWL